MRGTETGRHIVSADNSGATAEVGGLKPWTGIDHLALKKHAANAICQVENTGTKDAIYPLVV